MGVNVLRPQGFAPYGGLFPRSHAAAPNDAVVPAGLVGWWTMDVEDTNFVAATEADRSGNGKVGSLSGLTASNAGVGQIGQALNFNNTSSFINLSSFVIPPAFSFTCWHNLNALLSSARLFDNNSGTLIVQSSSAWSAQINSGATLSSGSIIVVGVWQFFVMTNDGTHVNFYLNGASVGAKNQAGASTSPVTGVYLGNRSGLSRQLNGLYDDVRFYNRSLDQGEVLQLYAAGLRGQAYWPSIGMPLMTLKPGFNPGWTIGRNTVIEGVAS
jgi:hypothetical protein